MADSIALRGVRQNNLRGIDLDLPLGRLTVITGPSGSGKSSLAFDTLYAEGQRRYIETFSPYTRQFLDRMDKPRADLIENIPPAIAIEQANHVRTTRSTVGTITEINDYLKLLFPRVARAWCPSCDRPVRPESAPGIAAESLEKYAGRKAMVTFGVAAPPGTKPAEFFAFLAGQGYLRVLLFGEVCRTDEPPSRTKLPPVVPVIQDRLEISSANRTRLEEALETALRLGQGRIGLWLPDLGEMVPHSSGWHCAHCDADLRPPSPGLFSFNNPLGACASCKGFGRVIGIDWKRVIPDPSLSLAQGAIRPFQSGQSAECQRDLLRAAAIRDVDVRIPYRDLPEADRQWVIEGDGGDPSEAAQQGGWYGVRGYFNWLESKTYKMHVRVLLSRYRSYCPCEACGGGRFGPDTLAYRLEPSGLRLPEVAALPVRALPEIFENLSLAAGDASAKLLRDQVVSRARYLDRVGLGYLTLDRPTRSLSGGEVERVNLTACLGASLTNTLFVLDEPSVGLHPRDTERLVEILHALRDKGNTLAVVEHEEAVIRAADHIVDIGPGRGSGGGLVCYSGPAARLLDPRARIDGSLTRDYLTGEKSIPVPEKRRKPSSWVRLKGIRHHNLKNLSADIPLGVLCCVTGVSGSGKSSLVNGALFAAISGQDAPEGEEAAFVKSVRGDEKIGEVVLVDQSPLARSPRSTPAVYVGAFDRIREIFGLSAEAIAAGLSPRSFTFNSGDGRCPRCNGLGYEKVEMQFLSDIFLKCPECAGSRFQPHILAIRPHGKSIADVLEMTVDEAVEFFSGRPDVLGPLALLQDVGLGYLRLGQPVNGLSGGESQRLKLAGHLAGRRDRGALLIFDEPTTGLHFDDIAKLLGVFNRLVDNGDHLVVVEHNLEVIKSADWVIDLGPEAGDDGGRIVAAGTPETVAAEPASQTGRFLAEVLEGGRRIAAPPAARKRPARESGAITIRGAREHNLKNLDLAIPRGKTVVVTGLSGSGKSTLAFDILFAEGQRRFLDSMSAYARQFVEQLEKPDVDSIEGLPPSVAIEQRVTRGGGKSTVATVTEIYHFLRLLFAKLGTQHCPDCDLPVVRQTPQAIAAAARKLAGGGAGCLYAPLIRGRKGFHTKIATWAARNGIETLLIDGRRFAVDRFPALERFKEHTIDALVGEFSARSKDIPALVARALELGRGSARIVDAAGKSHVLSTEHNCPGCGTAFEPLDPRLFSFNSPHGWCGHCRGFGEIWRPSASSKEFESQLEAELAEEKAHENLEDGEAAPCPICEGSRLNRTARHVFLQGLTVPAFVAAPASRALGLLRDLTFTEPEAGIARDIVGEIARRLEFLGRVGLDYLSLDRSAKTLSGGESQRIRLAAQLGSNLRGVLYVLDEPTIGLHARDNTRLLDALAELARNGNSLVIVEHDEETMRRADHILDLGPGAGSRGGEIVAQGSFAEICAHPSSLTGASLREPVRHPVRGSRRPLDDSTAWIELTGATLHNLRSVDARIPLHRLTVVTGISGSGKSSLVRGVLVPAVKDALSRNRRLTFDAPWKSLTGAAALGGVLEVDQSPIGKTSRSTPATYIKVLDAIRELYAGLPAARMRGYSASRFSFNTEGGRCEACLGQGVIKLEMNFLPPAYMPCEECGGSRFNRPTLEVEFNGKSIGDVMRMTAEEAAAFFSANPKIRRPLDLLVETGLGYLQLGQPSPTLSGGEAQRIKLVTQIARRPTGLQEEIRTSRRGKSTLYILEEPTIGLHAHDVGRLITVLHRLVDEGGTVVVVEHHLGLIAEADFVIDIGPEAGEDGGRIVATGTPEQLARHPTSHTAPFLRSTLNARS